MKSIILTVGMELQRMIKDRYFLFFSLLTPFIFYCLFTYINKGVVISGIDFDYFFLISMTCYSLVVNSVQGFGMQMMYDRRQTWMDYLFIHPVTSSQYFVARMLTQLLLNSIIVSVFFLVINTWKQFDRPIGEWIMTSVWLLVVSSLFLTIGILIAQSKKIQTASVTANIVVLGLAILGGLWMPLGTFPEWVQMIGEWLPSYLYARGAWNIAAGEGIEISNIIILVCYFLLCFIGAMTLQYRHRS
ncbi:ABC-2 type transport system permease protein [Terribacillus halophilus]|uniref:ABC-2 type transport system permease protein n=1 Tax=Terribacillus halophilus TaxID=361279 RepID=A0A1G6NPE0_9BACI|nr:ABC transporter permease [Terribacillus halophilus]SDC69521.1 ABC-2 type transport system permease protein [Terribacillus halophilus]